MLLASICFFLTLRVLANIFIFILPHLFVVSKEAFIVRSACSAAADEVVHIIIICIVVIMIIITFSPYQRSPNGQPYEMIMIN